VGPFDDPQPILMIRSLIDDPQGDTIGAAQ